MYTHPWLNKKGSEGERETEATEQDKAAAEKEASQ